MSLPMRERELKLCLCFPCRAVLLSLPMRERELKHGQFNLFVSAGKSLPMRERELKRAICRRLIRGVAPHAGA